MILQRIRIIVVDVEFEPGTSAVEVWRATNETPHPCINKYCTVKELTSVKHLIVGSLLT